MKWLKRILLGILILVGMVFLGGWLTVQLTPNPVSHLVRKQFDTSQQAQVYPRPDFYTHDAQEVSVEKDVSYQSTGKNNRMDIYTPKNQSKKTPILFWVHGGAYVGGDKRDCEDYLTMLSAKTNTVVVNLNYELAPEAKHPTPVRQLDEAIATIKERTIANIDWEQVLLGGDSAGAQIASEYLIRLSHSHLKEMNQLKPVLKSTQVKKFISLSGLLEPDKFAEVDDPISSFLFKQSGWAYFDQKDFASDTDIKDFTLANHANDLSQDFFFTDGNENTFTKQMETTAKSLEKAGLSVTEISYKKPTLGHEYQFDFSKPEAEKTFDALVRFVNDQS
ncbi:alpha/beta hydrolase [Enterococcus thailandicus]|uniref:alpha/beta hydrolase n=1 Tax=Enterococcus thailandicus TaxID=417368 RepID=UPI0022EC014D|nr:alpha/beta hydrolase [Enterococcus thailandicus]MDA3972670.1 alpha/beta hydrolase [Enterococcus thailandicus]MDA3975166.1 alpha/beta hydrolase [Enterococcus thailandicus]MDA3980130.1 alpha/beta hydrolase [Enterococcus thailandicus]